MQAVPKRLSRQQLETYEREGILFPVEVFKGEEVSLFRGALEALEGDGGGGALKRLDSLHLFFEWAYRLVTHDELLDAVEDILGGDILVYGTLVLNKPPLDTGYVTWHQDSFYSGLHLTPSTSAWIALTDSNPANGCMRVIPGSHGEGLLSHANVPDEANLLRRGERVAAEVDESRALDVVLRPGEMSLHQSTIIHGSNPNTTDGPRVGFIVRFVTDRVSNPGWPMLRVRGRADCSHLTLARPPALTDVHSAVSAWRAYSRH